MTPPSIPKNKRAMGFRVRGVGPPDDPLDGTEGLVFHHRTDFEGTGPGDYKWQDRLIAEPSTVPAGTDLRSGDVATQDYKIVLHNVTDVAERFQDQADEPDGQLTAEVDASTQDLPIDDGSLGVGTIVHIDTEAIELGTYDSGTGTYIGSTRGRFGTAAKAHQDERNVYTEIPYWRGRVVDLIFWAHYDEATYPVEKWGGYIRGIYESKNGTRLILETGSIQDRNFHAETHEAARQVPEREHGFTISPGVGINSTDLLLGGLPDDNFTSDVAGYQSQILKYNAWVSDNYPGAYQVAGGLFLNATAFNDKANRAVFGSEPELNLGSGKIPSEAPIKDGEHNVWEVAVFGRRFQDFVDNTGIDTPIPTSAMSSPHHPATIAAALVASTSSKSEDTATYDVLDGEMALGAADMLDLSAIDTLITETPHLEIDQLVLGWDGEPIETWDVSTKRLLRGYGLYWASKDDSDYTIERFTLIGVLDADDALSNQVGVLQRMDDHLLQRKNQIGSEADEVKVKIDGMPWREPDSIIAREDGTPKRPSQFAPGAKFTYDLTTKSGSEQSRDAIRAIAVNRLIKHRFRMPQLTVRVPDSAKTGVSYDVGATISLTDLGLADGEKHPVDSDGDRVEFDGSKVQWLSKITARRFEARTATYVLDLLFTNFQPDEVVRWRGPAMAITQDNSGGGDDKIYCDSNSQFGFGSPDNESFYEGHTIAIVDRTGALDSEFFTIDSIGSDGTGDFIQISGTFGLGDKTDQYARLCTYDDFDDNASTPNLDHFEVLWSYIADADESLGGNEDDAHIYGV